MSTEGGKIPFPNRLWRARKRRGLGQKQVAFLIEKSIDEVSRYERGIHLPELQTLLALEIVYGKPLRLLYRELYEQVRARITERIENEDTLPSSYKELLEQSLPDHKYCEYEDIPNFSNLPESKRAEVRSHVTRLARRLAGLQP